MIAIKSPLNDENGNAPKFDTTKMFQISVSLIGVFHSSSAILIEGWGDFLNSAWPTVPESQTEAWRNTER